MAVRVKEGVFALQADIKGKGFGDIPVSGYTVLKAWRLGLLAAAEIFFVQRNISTQLGFKPTGR